MTDPTTPTLPEESRGPNALEDARALLKYALEIVESDGGHCEATRLEERVARAYIKACEALEAIRDDTAVPPFVQLIARSALTTPAAVDTAKGGEPKEGVSDERFAELAEVYLNNSFSVNSADVAACLRELRSRRAAARKVLIEHNDKIMTVEQAEREGDDS